LAINVFFTTITVATREFFDALIGYIGQISLKFTPVRQEEIRGNFQ
jgi:hypothetical protein